MVKSKISEFEAIFYTVTKECITLPSGVRVYMSYLTDTLLRFDYEGTRCIVMSVKDYCNLLEELNGKV